MFSQSPANPAPHRPFIILSSVESTNNYAMAKLHAGMLDTGSAILALEQTAGKGQRGKKWITNPGENITMSIVFSPAAYFSLDKAATITSFPFLVSASIALGCYDFIKAFNICEVFLKWPNDVYINDRKAAGILIENVRRGSAWDWVVAGIGINLNQSEFEGISKAVSIKMIAGQNYELIAAGRRLHNNISHRFTELETKSADEIMQEYNGVLYKKNCEIRMKKDNFQFSSFIERVSIDGELITRDTMERRFVVGEVEFV